MESVGTMERDGKTVEAPTGASFDERVVSSIKALSKGLSAGVMVVGLAVLVGWAADISTLTRVLPGLVTMKANTAFAFLLSAAALWLLGSGGSNQWLRGFARSCSLLVAVAGLLTLCEYVFDWDPGIDQLLFDDKDVVVTSPPGRMAPATALCFLLFGCAASLADTKRRAGDLASQFLVLTVALISLIALLGYSYNVQSLYGVAPYTSMALHTAVALAMLSAGVLCLHPEQGVMAVIISSGAVSITARRLFVAALIILPVLGWVRLEGQRAGLYGTEFGVSVLVVLSTLIFSILMWFNARTLNRAHDDLRESEARFHAFFEFAPDGIVVVDRHGFIINVNTQAENMFGYKRKELLGKAVEVLIPERFGERHKIDHQNYSASPHTGPRKLGLDLRGKRKDGSEFPLSITLRPLRTTDGQVVMSVIRDISELKSAEEALRKSDARFRRLVESNMIGIIIADLHGKVLDANGAFLDLVGYTREDLIAGNVHWGRMTPEEYRPLYTKAMEEVKTSGVATPWQKEYIRKDGSRAPVLVGAALLEDSEDVCIAFVLDLAASKLAEDALREGEERYRDLIEGTHDLVQSVAPDGHFLFVNRAWKETLGYSDSDLLGITLFDIIEPDSRAHCHEIFSKLLAGEPVDNMQVTLLAKDGKPILLEGAATARHIGERVVATQAFFRNITEKRHLEDQFRQSQKMEAIGRLAGGVAHDFNNLLTAIIGYSQLALGRLHREDPMRKEIEEIERAGQRAAGLTNQLLAFSRRQVLQPQVLDLNAVVADIAKMLERLIGEDVVLATSLAPNIGFVKADRGQIEQIIMNLAVNSRDAMPDGGKLTIETFNADLDESYTAEHINARPGPHVVLAISDNGSGIDKETQSNIFEPFFTTKEQGKGTGLGLSTVFGIVNQSGGHIGLYSEPGKGTTFKVYLPRLEEADEKREPRVSQSESLEGSETVLLVEDEDSVRELARRILEMYGYVVLEAAGGDDTRRICEGHEGRINLMLTDVVMPGANGRELAQMVAPLQPEMKVLYMSGYTDDAIVQHGALSADTPFLQKPFTPATLARKVREVLDKN